MTITAYGTGAYRAAKPNEFVSTRAQFDDLQRQLDTKQRSTSYGDLGIDRRVSLDLNSKVSQLDSWLSGIGLTGVNLKLQTSSVENFTKLTNETRNDTRSNSYVPSASGRSSPQVLAEEKFKQTLDLLNISVNGRYLFSGKTSDTQPTLGFNEIVNGDGAGKDGLKQMIDERRQADLGSGQGRLTVGGAGTTATISEEATVHPYGFKIAGITGSSAALATTFNPGPPADVSANVASQPVPGDTVRIQLKLPDGTQEEVVLTARAPGTTGSDADSFEIGVDVNATAANLRTSIGAALGKEAQTTLSAASSQVAAQDFFAGSLNNPPKRVPGPPFDTATLPPTNAGAAATTVIWYRGDDGADPARSTSTVQIDQGQTVGTGARANEEAFRVGLAQFAIMAVENFPAGDTNSQARYEAMTSRVSEKLGFGGSTQKPAEIITELGSAQTALASAKERHQSTKDYLTTTLAGVENVTTEEVATQILSLQTQLQASYQVTSMLSKLSLTNYL
ncbi:flagellin [uncultured Bosea sp.]|uniref:flagellin n=1 Tax=uncultured Bosea sp. TaxID=211457 RepID=UPI00263B5ED7|nr:flagellin [uncultured Bosea sp.]